MTTDHSLRDWRELRQSLTLLHRSEEPAWSEIRARQVQAIVRLSPLSMGANLFNAGLVVWLLWSVADRRQLAAWSAAIGLACAVTLWTWWRRRGVRPDATSPRAVRRLALHAGVLALLWSVPTVLWFPGAPHAAQLTLASVACGMLCAGVFLLAGLPAAGFTYTAVLLGACFLALALEGDPALWPTGVLLAVYGVILVAGMLSAARISVARLLNEREAARQGHMVSLLLRDFEEHAADMLWETDRRGRLTHLSPRLVAMLSDGRHPLENGRTTLLEAIVRRGEGSVASEGVEQLQRAMAQGKPFRDLTIAMGPQGAEGRSMWWSVTAKPLLDEEGRAHGWRGVVADITAQRAAKQGLEFLAHHDPLTRLANRTRLRDHLRTVLDRLRDEPPAADAPRHALLCLDLDHFKSVNDALGHSVGDAVLVAVARRLQAMMAPQDLVARMGGDEFAAVLAPRGPAELDAWCDGLLALLKEPVVVQERRLPVGASVGVALLPDDGLLLDDVMVHADMALYAAKSAGRGRWHRFDADLGEQARRQTDLERALREALEQGELTLHWQPLVHIEGWRITGAEALLRWRHPVMGMVSPVEFIPVAERTGLIVQIGRWVLEQACVQGSRHLDGLTVSVNVSPVQLMEPDFVAVVEQALASSGLPSHRLQIEVTESVLVEDPERAKRAIQRIQALGVKVALDDFGTGYSSLAYLRRFRFNTLKIDRAFVRELLGDHDARQIVRTIIGMAGALGMHSVAEGVEDEEQLEVLRQAGCRAFQGYLATPPLALDDLLHLLSRWVDGARPVPGTLPDTMTMTLSSRH